MEYQKTISLLNNKPNQPSKFKAKNWFEIYNESRDITKIIKLDLNLQCWGQVYLIIAMHIYYKLQKKHRQHQIIPIKR